jgi:hypothetical protein
MLRPSARHVACICRVGTDDRSDAYRPYIELGAVTGIGTPFVMSRFLHDEMWHFIQSKKEKSGLLKPWIVAQGVPLPGYSVVVMLQRSIASMIKSTIGRTVYFIQTTGTHLPRCYLKSVISLAKHIPMRLNEIIPIRDITALG